MRSRAIKPKLIRSFEEIDRTIDRSAPVVTLFSGGLDSSYLLLRLRELGFTQVHALSVDIGGLETVEEQKHIASELGAVFHSVDKQQVFAAEFVAPAIKAHAVYLGLHPVSSTLSRPLIARTAVDLAHQVEAGCVIHTANRSQNTLRRLNGALGMLGFPGRYGSPYDLQPVDRTQKIEDLSAAGITFSSDRTMSGDSNLWCREYESGSLDDPESHRIPDSIYRWSVTPQDDHLVAEELSLSFEEGIPTAVDGERMDLVELIGQLNVRVGRFGVGRYTGLEHLDHGEKVLEVREMPAAWLILMTARHLESACLTAETLRVKLDLEQLWVREALEGRWLGSLKRAAEAFIDSCAARVTGSVRWRLHLGGAVTTAIIAEHPTYIRDREAWETASIRAELSHYSPLLSEGGLIA
ncbi:argininosuccinate synthase-related protein [Nocardia sp. NPDC058058]|uniref:argininosuccinate synthase-related protein n=1 Tax=Nocardia sp. NPDC058058 TaxID=3346317 RepID=UPI0036DBEF4F